ncbi:murein DD-endopeptidase MepM/ murein hydrolase activator NlpD [Winogradskyella eximia]|jgi:murein DD-endopeptidase MepM/ murein hydrolase activator NlpD|uniref:Murein DD-endopeptidase MepM/ murein hydrolase activator NlpD n=1 Tax=Winogradskyella eximia TaxID=262006 RepID=A0A3D9HAT6_9FLAO|nr:peptidoglycan DD-metalloendopeptidase family protein [Winogradskyella eximia]RED46602.1 murein DD-endopeptidase MepM/ murein hydrolase activator NlpD [Winogradskyella eximia]|tara:strand:+ start:1115 stop:2428 length:1314 start_codon:yes stop_codon:yes gene_type:complete
MQLKRLVVLTIILIGFFACKEDNSAEVAYEKELSEIVEEEKILEFGFDINNYIVKRDTIQQGDSFGEILQRNNIGYPDIFQIAEVTKDTFDIRRLHPGKPYTLLFSKESEKDSLPRPETFIYQTDPIKYVVINLKDSIYAYTNKKPVTYVEKTATGIIESSISSTLEDKGLSQKLAYKMADEIYAWTIDFRRLQKGDRFKVIYTDKYIDDTIYAGVHNVKAAYFEHNGDSLYAFQFETDSIKGIVDYFNEDAKNLRRAFLKAPVQFSRISSRYNLKRRIAFYGNKVRPHKGTDFAAAIGTPIMATANGTVTESTRRGGNGKYVKIRHNDTYSTQYLHMSKQAVKKGQFVKQGDIIGYVGMTGNTGGPHVCYRFWKNGQQVDPFKQKLPEAKPISDSLKVKFLEHIKPVKQRLDNIFFLEAEPIEPENTITQDLTIDL